MAAADKSALLLAAANKAALLLAALLLLPNSLHSLRSEESIFCG